MSTPDPEGMSLLAKVMAAGAAVVAPLWGAWKWFDARLEKKADKHAVNNQFHVVNGELSTLRTTQGKIFDQIRENEQRAQDRHERLMERLPR